ncbi:MAG TPA: Gfo/Idh/MocA family oxidoreductase [Chloroflexota bacterium]|nr:Gfo/Idh/MocA family oxidoreductase [Chloroflexota bacterium]
MIRVGIVGYGYAGRNMHAYLISRVPDLKLVAVASRSPERRLRAEQDHGVTTFVTLDELLDRGEVDLVVIVTPHNTHAALACQAMDAHKHVVVDKVMCLNGEEADAMIEASRRDGVMLSVFHNRRWDWDYLTVKKVLEEGLLGDPYLFEMALLSFRTPRGWRGEAEAGGGILFDWGAHFIDQALQLVPGEVTSVTCDIQYRGWGQQIGSYGRLLLRFGSGVLYSIELGNLARFSKPHWLVLGERGSLVKSGIDPQEPALLRGNIEAAVEDPSNRARVTTDIDGLSTEMVVESVKSDWTNYYRNVADALAGRAELAVQPEQVRRAIAVYDAAMRSARSGETVSVRI